MMYRRLNNRPQKKVQRDIILIQQELIQDIRNNAFIHSKGIVTDDPDARAKVNDVAEFNNREKMFRTMALAFGEITQMLMPFSAEWNERENSLITDAYKEPEAYTIHLHVPEKFPEATFHYLDSLAHEFIVARVIYEYLRLTNPDAASVWYSTIEDLMSKIKEIANKNYGIVQRPLQPF